MKVVALIQARMGSERLPGKVLKTLAGHTLLEWVTRRVKQSQRVDQVVLATTLQPADDAIVAACEALKIPVYRGSETDVLARFYGAAMQYHADVIVRICSDCPFIDSMVIDSMLVDFFEKNKDKKIDYLSNTLTRTYPRGLDVEIISMSALKAAYEQADKTSEREHVTPYIYFHPDQFAIEQWVGQKDYSHYRWTVDTEEDYIFLQSLANQLEDPTDVMTTATSQWMACVENNPSLMNINGHVRQKEVDRTC